MFEIFIALFGGIYYGSKLLGEHVDHKEATAEWQTQKLEETSGSL